MTHQLGLTKEEAVELANDVQTGIHEAVTSHLEKLPKPIINLLEKIVKPLAKKYGAAPATPVNTESTSPMAELARTAMQLGRGLYFAGNKPEVQEVLKVQPKDRMPVIQEQILKGKNPLLPALFAIEAERNIMPHFLGILKATEQTGHLLSPTSENVIQRIEQRLGSNAKVPPLTKALLRPLLTAPRRNLTI